MKKVLLFILLLYVQSFAQLSFKNTNGEFYFINKTTLDTVKVVVIDSSFRIAGPLNTFRIDSLTTVERDALVDVKGRFIFNSTDNQFQGHDGSTWVNLGASAGSGAPTTATYITQTPDASLTAEQALNTLPDGILKHSSGVLAQAVSGTDYVVPSGSGASLTSLDGENIQDDTIDDDALDFVDITLADFTDDVGYEEETHVSEHETGGNDEIDLQGLNATSDGDSLKTNLFQELYALDLETNNTRVFAVDSSGNVFSASYSGNSGVTVLSDDASVSDGDLSVNNSASSTNLSINNTAAIGNSNLLFDVDYNFAGSLLSQIIWNFENSINSGNDYANLQVAISDNTSGSESGRMIFNIDMNGSIASFIDMIGYTGTSNEGKINFNAQGRDINFLVESDIDTSLTVVGSDGGVLIGNPTGGSQGSGTLNVENGIYAGNASVLEIPNGTTDATLGAAGQIHINETDDQFSMHMGSTGEVSGEASISVLKHVSVILYPSTDYDQDATNRNFPLFTIGDDFPEGIIIDEWQLTYTTGDPTTELDANLYRASNWAFTGETSMDVLDTTAGSSSEDTDANINGGAVVANGQKIYIGFDADPTDDNTIVIFEMWFHGEED